MTDYNINIILNISNLEFILKKLTPFYAKIIIKINNEIKDSFDFAKKSNFPVLNSWEEMNFSNKSPVADKILKDLEQSKFDEDQKIVQAKGY